MNRNCQKYCFTMNILVFSMNFGVLTLTIRGLLTDTFNRAVARSENLGGHIVMGGDNVPPLVEIGLTDLTKSGGHKPPPPPPPACNGPVVSCTITPG